jgi:hypothetical protein
LCLATESPDAITDGLQDTAAMNPEGYPDIDYSKQKEAMERIPE